MSEPSTWGERRRRREEERRRAAEQAAQQAASGDATPDDVPAPEPPMTRRQRREAERAAAERAAAEQAAVGEAATGPAGPVTEPPATEPPRPRRPVVRPPTMAHRPGVSVTGPAPPAPPTAPPTEQPRPPTPPTSSTRPTAPAPPADRPPRGRPTQAVLPEQAPQPRRRRRWVVPAAAAVVAGLVLTVLALTRGGTEEPPDVVTGPPASTATALLTLEQEGRLTGASVLSVGEQETAALLVPSRLVVDVAGGGRVPLAESVAVSDDAPGNAVADALDLRVDGTWVLTAEGMSQLVDDLGGVDVEVDTEVRAGDVLLVPGAEQRLTGVQAGAYATYLGDGEAEALRLARQDRVLTAIFAALPPDAGGVQELLDALGEGSRTTLPDGWLAEMLAGAAAHVRDGAYGASVLPVTEIATGGDETLYGLDDAAAAEVLDSRFAGAQRDDSQAAVRVLVQNGVGVPGLGDDARTRLVEAGFRFVGGGNAASLGRERSVVLVPSDSTADRDAGLAVAEALGLPADVVAVGQEAPTTADVIVVLGADFAETAGR